jgi:hypothetical protein
LISADIGTEKGSIVKKAKRVFIIFSLVISLALIGMMSDQSEGERSFKAELSVEEEVPPVKTNARGEAIFKLNKGGDELIYLLTVKNIENVTAAHIYQGQKGRNGPPMVTLFSEPEKPSISGTLYVEGTIRAYEFIGPLKGKPLHSLVQMIEAGEVYLNVHTVKHKEGEIRGQIK